MVNKKAVIIATIIAIILVSGIVYMGLKKASKVQYTESDRKVENSVENNTIDNKSNNENNNEIDENDIVENNTEENEVNDVDENTTEDNETKNETTETKPNTNTTKEEKPDEKAISLVKKEWGEKDNTVYYYIEEQISDNVFIVSVRDSDTTEDLSSYKVNIKTGKVEKD